MVVQLRLQSETVVLVNVYAPTQSEPRKQLAFMDTLESAVINLDTHTFLMGGDFNAHLDTNHSNSNPYISTESLP